MAKDNSPHVVGHYWLDKRPDGKSPEVWQIASYDIAARTVRYRSTRLKDVKAAIDAVDAIYLSEKALKPQTTEAMVVPQLILYWKEHGRKAVNPITISVSLRQFIAFLFIDPVGPTVTFDELKPEVIARFKAWRSGPHGYSIDWDSKKYTHQSKGVVGETIQRDLNTIRAALNHSVDAGRVPYAPKIKGVTEDQRSPAKDRILSLAEMGAMVGYATTDPELLRFIVALVATAARPTAIRRCIIAKQANMDLRLFDVHPHGDRRTKKRNPVVPMPHFWRPWLREWLEDNRIFPVSGKKRWRTMRRVLNLEADVDPKTIRYTVATFMRSAGVPFVDIEGQLGHVLRSQSDVYAKYAPDYLAHATRAIDSYWLLVLTAAKAWLADHLRTKVGNGETFIAPKRG